MRILGIAPQPFFTPRGTPMSVYYRTLAAAELGVQTDLIAYGEGLDVEIPNLRIFRVSRLPFFGPVRVGPSLHKAVLDVLVFVKAVWLLLRNRYQVVHAHEEAVFFCGFLKPIFGFKLVYDMHSCLPQQLVNFGWHRPRFLHSLFQKLEKASLKASDAVITICPALYDYASELLPDSNALFLIENSIYEEIRLKGRTVNGAPHPDALLEGIDKKGRIVAYAGTLELYQGLGLLLQAFAKVVESCPQAFLLILGGRPDQVARYARMAEGLGIDRGAYLFAGQVPRQAVKGYLSRAAVLTSPRISGTNTPLKIYEQLDSGQPLVATRIFAHTQVLDESVCFLADPEPEPFAEAIIEALTQAEKGKRLAANARQLYQVQYSRPAYMEKMRLLLEAVR